ncbi:MAG: tyrosine-type recombinase/integrase [Alphaproteobacteria bacterium]|jgi:integrase/recombinase XerD|nr:tyrosine-type recombinase/integrase [Alphaproteobacteria bacterium]OJV12571.1 MAG: hypothetical protein BGO27_03510 [Alphaproteobacteria bacterium 33-17]
MTNIEVLESRDINITLHKESQNDSLGYWLDTYFATQVLNAAPGTIKAKKNDITKFLEYFYKSMKTDNIDFWTTSVSKGFQNHLLEILYNFTYINRIFATIRHAARWIHTQRNFLAGNPLKDVMDIGIEEPQWRGLDNLTIQRLKASCEHRIALCTRANQNPLMEVAVFYTLLYTGLRVSELVRLNIEQYHSRGFHNVIRKGRKVSKKIPLPSDAKERVDLYLQTRKELLEKEPLFVSKSGKRLTTRDVSLICDRIAKQASVKSQEPIKLSPHMLRHTVLKAITKEEGIEVAHRLSGNTTIKELLRYIAPTHEELAAATEKLFKK